MKQYEAKISASDDRIVTLLAYQVLNIIVIKNIKPYIKFRKCK